MGWTGGTGAQSDAGQAPTRDGAGEGEGLRRERLARAAVADSQQQLLVTLRRGYDGAALARVQAAVDAAGGAWLGYVPDDSFLVQVSACGAVCW